MFLIAYARPGDAATTGSEFLATESCDSNTDQFWPVPQRRYKPQSQLPSADKCRYIMTDESDAIA